MLFFPLGHILSKMDDDGKHPNPPIYSLVFNHDLVCFALVDPHHASDCHSFFQDFNNQLICRASHLDSAHIDEDTDLAKFAGYLIAWIHAGGTPPFHISLSQIYDHYRKAIVKIEEVPPCNQATSNNAPNAEPTTSAPTLPEKTVQTAASELSVSPPSDKPAEKENSKS